MVAAALSMSFFWNPLGHFNEDLISPNSILRWVHLLKMQGGKQKVFNVNLRRPMPKSLIGAGH